MKRALLIAGGTVGGLGAVLAITPPQFTSTQDVSGLSGSLGGGTGAVQTTPVASTPAATKSAAAPVATKAVATKKATTKASASATAAASQSASSAPVASATPTPSATHTTAAPATGGYSGTVTGATFQSGIYGSLSATVTFLNGKITKVSANQSPTSWSEGSLSVLRPFVSSGKITVEQIKQYPVLQLPCSHDNNCRSRASFSAESFWSSVKSAITKAGL